MHPTNLRKIFNKKKHTKKEIIWGMYEFYVVTKS